MKEDVKIEAITALLVQEEEIEIEEPAPHSNEADHVEMDEHKATLDLLGPAYARNSQYYWKVLLFTGALQGMLLGIVAPAFFTFTAPSKSIRLSPLAKLLGTQSLFWAFWS
jgi:hypothetical protein